MDENEMNGMEEDLIVFQDEDGNEYSFVVQDYLFYNGEEYALLADAAADQEAERRLLLPMHSRSTMRTATLLTAMSWMMSPMRKIKKQTMP